MRVLWPWEVSHGEGAFAGCCSEGEETELSQPSAEELEILRYLESHYCIFKCLFHIVKLQNIGNVRIQNLDGLF